MNLRDPLFVHSLWRAGSTYMFAKFRQLPEFYCFQEPLHETLLLSIDGRDDLLLNEEIPVYFNHPDLSRPHFFEAWETRDHWRSSISKEIIYDEYFDEEISPALIGFYQSLMAAAPRRPLFQECRTSARVGGIRQALGGTHIHLWRSPWAQWWSFLKDRYFGVASLLILNAHDAPLFIRSLRQELGIAEFHSTSIVEEFEHFYHHPLSASQYYKLFFAIWCVSFLHAQSYSDIDIQLDRLAAEPEYRSAVESRFADLGIQGLQFDDCRLDDPQFRRDEEIFYRAIEEEIFAALGESVSPEDIAALQRAVNGQVGTSVERVRIASDLRQTGRRLLDDSALRIAYLEQDLNAREEQHQYDLATVEVKANAKIEMERQIAIAAREQVAGFDTAQQALQNDIAGLTVELAQARDALISRMAEAHEAATRQSQQHDIEVRSLFGQVIGAKDQLLAQAQDRLAAEGQLRQRIQDGDVVGATLSLKVAEQEAVNALLIRDIATAETACHGLEARIAEYEAARTALQEHLAEQATAHAEVVQQLRRDLADRLAQASRENEDAAARREDEHRATVALLNRQLDQGQGVLSDLKSDHIRIVAQLEVEMEAFRSRHDNIVAQLERDVSAAQGIAVAAEADRDRLTAERDEERQGVEAERLLHADEVRQRSERIAQMEDAHQLLHADFERVRGVVDRLSTSRLPSFVKRRLLEGTVTSSLGEEGRAVLTAEIGVIEEAQPDWLLGEREAMAVEASDMQHIASVQDLLVLDDALFVKSAYLVLLGREPDAEGMAFYLARVRRGASKLMLLRQLRLSPEGQSHLSPLHGLDRAVRLLGWSRMPVVGAFVRRFWNVEGNSAGERELRIVANALARNRQTLIHDRQSKSAELTTLRSLIAQDIADIRHVTQLSVEHLGANLRQNIDQVGSGLRQDIMELRATIGDIQHQVSTAAEVGREAQATLANIRYVAMPASRLTGQNGTRTRAAPGTMERFLSDMVGKS